MNIYGRIYTEVEIELIQDLVTQNPTISRRRLSVLICQALNWQTITGEWKTMSCRKALVEMNRRGIIHLARRPQPVTLLSPAAARPIPTAAVACSLAELGPIELQAVGGRTTQAARVWNALLDRHPLGRGRLCGAQQRYLITSSQYGWLGGLSFSSGSWKLKQRDQWIGWSAAARRANLPLVIRNSRFWIAPEVRVPNLATHVLSLATARVKVDWRRRYGVEPVLMETFVDPRYCYGTLYKAANWLHVGQTAGRRVGARGASPKDIYLLPLQPHAGAVLQHHDPPPAGPAPRPAAQDWAEEEFRGVPVEDPRLKRRIYTVARDFMTRIGESISVACGGSEAKTKGAYRMAANPTLNLPTLLQGHLTETISRMRPHRVVLAVQDTTTLSYSDQHNIEGLGPVNKRADQSVGILLHATMAYSSDGTALGLLNVQSWTRSWQDRQKHLKRHELPLEEKESKKWLEGYRAVCAAQTQCPDTMAVSVSDQESDIYELCHEAQKPGAAHLLLRANGSRLRKVAGVYLWPYLEAQALAGRITVVVAKASTKGPAREATVEVRFAPVTLSPPRRLKRLPRLSLWAIYAREVNYAPEVKEPIDWMLLTTVPTTTFEAALERIAWYKGRWAIEVYFRTVKSGCHIEDRRLTTVNRLETMLAIDLVVAWRVSLFVQRPREFPDVPCDCLLRTIEWQVLYLKDQKKAPPPEPPSLLWACRAIAKMGGFLGRKGDGHPGATYLWRGLEILADLVEGYTIAAWSFRSQNARDGP